MSNNQDSPNIPNFVKNIPLRVVFYSLHGVCKCGKTRSIVFDVLLKITDGQIQC